MSTFPFLATGWYPPVSFNGQANDFVYGHFDFLNLHKCFRFCDLVCWPGDHSAAAMSNNTPSIIDSYPINPSLSAVLVQTLLLGRLLRTLLSNESTEGI